MSCRGRGRPARTRRGRCRRIVLAQPGLVTILSMTKITPSVMAQPSSRDSSRQTCCRASLRDAEHRHRHEPVDAAFEDTSRGGHTRGVERVGVGDAFVTQRIVAGDDDDRGRQTCQVRLAAVRRTGAPDRRPPARTGPSTSASPASGCRNPCRTTDMTRCRSRRRSPDRSATEPRAGDRHGRAPSTR